MLLFSCVKEDKEDEIIEIQSNLECLEGKLEIITDENCCDIEPNFLTCEILKVEELNIIDEDSYSWLPNACTDINTDEFLPIQMKKRNLPY